MKDVYKRQVEYNAIYASSTSEDALTPSSGFTGGTITRVIPWAVNPYLINNGTGWHDLEIDYEEEMARIQSEMKEIMMQEKKSQQMLEDAFRGIGYGID